MAKKDKIQYVLNFAADFLSLCVSVLLSWLVTDKVLHVLLDYTQEDWGQFILILAFAFLVVFLGGNGASGLTRRSWRAELWLCVKNTLLLAAALAVALLLTKATMLESRYMYVGVLGLHFVGLFVTHTALKTYLNRYFYKANFATMVGIITTVDRAEPLLRDLKQDWAKKLQGVVLLDAPAPGGQVAGIPVAATYEGAMDWIRREPLDEVYVSVPYQSGDSLRPLLSEMESMGLCVPPQCHGAGTLHGPGPGGQPLVPAAALPAGDRRRRAFCDHRRRRTRLRRHALQAVHRHPGGAGGAGHLGADHRGHRHPPQAGKSRPAFFQTEAGGAQPAGSFPSTNCAACMWMLSSASRS